MDATHGKTRSKLPTAPCGHCKAPVRIEKHRRPAFERGDPVYCNREHRMAAVGRQVTVTCSLPGCGIEFQKHAADAERSTTGRFFCTREHAEKGGPKPRRGGEVPCDACGTPVYLRPSDLAEHEAGAKHYCDMDCKAAGMRGERVERDEQTCIVCGTAWRRTLDQMYQDVKTCKRECTSKARRRQLGERYIDPDGYAWITTPDGRNMPEHIYVMEQEFGGPLPKGSTVHHKTGGFKGRSNNALSNLELWTGNHPKGHRVEDVTDYCLDHLRTYRVALTPEQRAGFMALAMELALDARAA